MRFRTFTPTEEISQGCTYLELYRHEACAHEKASFSMHERRLPDEFFPDRSGWKHQRSRQDS
jgi:hypothetical protein